MRQIIFIVLVIVFTYSLAVSKIFETHYPNMGIQWQRLDVLDSDSIAAQCITSLTEKQKDYFNKRLKSNIYGLRKSYMDMFKKPPSGFERPGQGSFVFEFTIDTVGKIINIVLVENSMKYIPLQQLSEKFFLGLTFRKLGLATCFKTRVKIQFLYDTYKKDSIYSAFYNEEGDCNISKEIAQNIAAGYLVKVKKKWGNPKIIVYSRTQKSYKIYYSTPEHDEQLHGTRSLLINCRTGKVLEIR